MNEFARKAVHHWESDAHIRVPTQPSQILLWLTSSQGVLDFLSPSWSRFCGVDRVTLIADCWDRVVHPDDLKGLHAAFQRAATESKGFRRHVRLRRRDGVYCSMAFESLPRVGAMGETIGFTGFCLDLSPAENSWFEANLADHRIGELLLQVRLPALVVDLDGKLVFFNAPFLDLVDEPSREATCRPFFGRYAEAIDEVPAEFLRRIADAPPHAFDCAIRDTRGVPHLLSWHVTALRDESGNMTCAVLIGDDISAQRDNEAQLRLTQRVFEATDQAMVITDSSAQIISVNQAFSRLTGYSQADAVGQNPRVLQSGRHDQAFYQRIRKIGENDGEFVATETRRRIVSPNGAADTRRGFPQHLIACRMPDLSDPLHAARVAEKIKEKMDEAFLVDGKPLFVSSSIGISLFPADHHQPARLLELADQAMYQVKARGANGYLFYADLATALDARNDNATGNE